MGTPFIEFQGWKTIVIQFANNDRRDQITGNHKKDIDAINGTADSDDDGVLDFFEYLYGSDPNSAADSGFRFSAETNGPGDAVILRWEILEGPWAIPA